MPDRLIPPHGGELKELLVRSSRAAELKEASRDWTSWDLTDRQMRDLELLLNGGFIPLAGFMNRPDYEAVRDGMRLADDTLWPIPITLDVGTDNPEALSSRCFLGSKHGRLRGAEYEEFIEDFISGIKTKFRCHALKYECKTKDIG